MSTVLSHLTNAKHRLDSRRKILAATPRRALRNKLRLGAVALGVAAVTGAALVPGPEQADLSAGSYDSGQQISHPSAPGLADGGDAERGQEVSRSDRRADSTKARSAALDQSQGGAVTRTHDLADAAPRQIGKALLGEYGFSEGHFGCLDSLWTRESNWRVTADNPTSSAYGIPQALPGHKMASEGRDWKTNAVTQIRWGLDYIDEVYGNPCNAWGHSQAHGWY